MYGGNKVTMLVVMIIVVHNNDYNDINKNNQDNANNNNLNYQDINVCIKSLTFTFLNLNYHFDF